MGLPTVYHEYAAGRVVVPHPVLSPQGILICVPSHHCVGEIGQIRVVTLYLQSSLHNLITNSSKKLKHYLFISCAL